MRAIIITVSLLMLLTARAAAAPQVSFTVSADRLAASPGERVTVVATLVAPKAVGGAPHPAASDAFDLLNVNTSQSQSTNIQMVNGRVEHTSTIVYRYIYTIMPKTGGAFAFPPLTVNIDGASYSTRPLNFNSGSGGGGGGGTGGGHS
ncbi:MAG: BatD family protein, partial [Chitinispirillia bacterium]|nr:BatD family protein [Chitinispirillia bacterium]